MNRKGIILAGGNGTRLYPLTLTVSKQLLPVYDKPMIYYPLTTLMLGGIKEILLITTQHDLKLFNSLLGDGSRLGLNIKYAVQEKPEGLAQAFLIGEDFIGDSDVTLILGDNLFHGDALSKKLQSHNNFVGATIFGYSVKDPERYGVIYLNSDGGIEKIIEKPSSPKSSLAVTGLYIYDNSVIEKSKKIKPSERGELEISDINNLYLEEGKLNIEIMSRGIAWLDTGKFDSLHDAGGYIRTLENRQGLKIGSPEEAAWRMGWISDEKLYELGEKLNKSDYGKYLQNLIKDPIIKQDN